MSPLDGTNSFAEPVALTLADVVARAAATALSARQKSEIISAVNSAALWLQRTPGEIPANQEYLRRAFERLTYGPLGVGIARFRNVQSLLKQALAIAGVPTSRTSYPHADDRGLADAQAPHSRLLCPGVHRPIYALPERAGNCA